MFDKDHLLRSVYCRLVLATIHAVYKADRGLFNDSRVYNITSLSRVYVFLRVGILTYRRGRSRSCKSPFPRRKSCSNHHNYPLKLVWMC